MWRGARLYASWAFLALGACDSGDGEGGRVMPAPSASTIERYCVAVTACVGGGNVAGCIELEETSRASTTPTPAWRNALFDCVRSAGADCAAIEACQGAVQTGMVCEERIESCQGTVRAICERADEPLRGEDCAASGRVCVMESETTTACVDSVCDETSQSTRCDGDDVITCSFGRAERRICPSEAPCAPYDSPFEEVTDRCGGDAECREACEGDQLVRCADDFSGSLSAGERIDCAALGQRCVASGGFIACETEELDEECEEDPAGLCASGVVEICVFGRRRRIDCRSIGWEGCTSSSSGPSCVRAGA